MQPMSPNQAFASGLSGDDSSPPYGIDSSNISDWNEGRKLYLKNKEGWEKALTINEPTNSTPSSNALHWLLPIGAVLLLINAVGELAIVALVCAGLIVLAFYMGGIKGVGILALIVTPIIFCVWGYWTLYGSKERDRELNETTRLIRSNDSLDVVRNAESLLENRRLNRNHKAWLRQQRTKSHRTHHRHRIRTRNAVHKAKQH